jgi:septal ring factor EnvC (AmiA/AmiB activator)
MPMLYPHKPILETLLIFALFFVPITKAISDDLPQQINQLQTQLMEANEKIATLASDQQKTARTISTLQTGLNTASQEIIDLKNSSVFKRNELVALNAGILRTANGHGRGGR